MRFDDRLLTVLNQPAGDRHDVAVRWRQLVDLVARAGSNAASPAVVEALETIRTDAPGVDEALRSAAARAIASLPLPFGLLEYFASGELSVSAPVLAAATLDHGQWQSMLRVTDEETRRFIETLHPELRSVELTDKLVEAAPEQPAPPAPSDEIEDAVATPEPIDDLAQRMSLLKQAVEQVAAAPATREAVHGAPSLHEVVQRIEGRRRSRSTESGARRSVSATAPGLFRWECGPGGEIGWVDGAPRGALIGRSIARQQSGAEGVGSDVARAFAVRAPFREGELNIGGEGAVAGTWKISGVPAFDPADGRFRGYRGIAIREQEDGGPAEESAGALADPASVRELVHEVKTPLNAIVGFAEIIEGQYLGPADRPYRERAEDIVRQARLLLTAIDDVDFVAKVHFAAEGAARRVNLSAVVEELMPKLLALAEEQNLAIETSRLPRSAAAASEPELAERLIVRLGAALIEQANAGERLRLTIERAANRLRLSMTLPDSLAALSKEQLLGDGPEWEQGFSLRLIRRLARMAGADMAASQGSVSILFAAA